MESPPTTADEAHDYVMEIVKRLQASGVVTTVKMYDTPRGDEGSAERADWDRHYQSVLDKYGKLPERADPQKWCNISFQPKDGNQLARIAEVCVRLTRLGIMFDSGGGCGSLDWELDWSFRFKEDYLEREDYSAAVDLINTYLADLFKED